jgi:adenosylhomocysteine nucleosidase
MTIGIIGAMEEEVTAIKNKMNVHDILKKAGMLFFVGEFSDSKLVVVESGIGKVNAAICAQILIDDFKVERIINTGIAGGVNEKVNPGDIVISTELVYHDIDTSAFGDKVGQVPRMDVYAFPADDRLIKLAEACAEKITEHNVFQGRIISGDQFIANSEKIKELREVFGAYAVEMEGAAIGHACYVNNIPFVVIRSISDRADGDVHIDYWTFKNIAINNSVEMITNMIENM